jgi:hypothetical protein
VLLSQDPGWRKLTFATNSGYLMTTINRVAFLGDYMPRQCGIATFTTDICEAVAAAYPHCECIVGAVNDRPEGYDYSTRIRFEIDEKEIDSYRRAADF